MQNLFLYCFSIFFFFSCATQQLAYSKPFLFHTHKNNNRRILHEPFMPLNSLSPSQPPKPPPQPKPPLPSYSSTSTSTSTSTSNTKHPFSTTITTPNNNNNDDNNPNQDQSPFFPNYPPLSPPPPSPITFASFPANISSLVIPHTTQPTSSSNKLLPIILIAVSIAVAVVFAIFTFVYFRRRYRNRRAADNKSLRSDSSLELFPRNGETVAVAGTGSEFLYLGTVVNSRRIDDTQRSGVLDSRKLESPELRPLPPLARYPEPLPPPPRGGGGTCSEEEDEEFYSPRGSSLGGLESSGGTGSCSRRAFSAIAARKSGESSSISCSSSSFGSPEHSHSISLSPPASSSPPRTHSKSPETTPPHSVSTFSSQQHVQSSSQERVLEKNEDALSARVSNASNGSVKSIISSSSAFSLPSSPEKVMMMHHHSTFDQSPRLSSVSEGLKIPGLSSRPLSPSLLSSPEIERGGFNYTSNYAATVPHRKLWEIPIAPVPPPPPPLPLQRQRKHWGMPASSIPVGQSHQVLRPPELVPPSRPFVLQNTIINEGLGEIEETSKLKLKPLHWDKVRTSSDREMVWDHLKSSSFKLNEEMIETLFVVNNSNQNSKDAAPRSVFPLQNQEDRVLDPKKSQNIAILLKALNVTKEEVCEALLQGSADTLGTELLESLLKMAPSEEEIRKLKEHKDDSPTKLDVAEGFLKAVLDIPFAFKRVEAMLYMVNFESEVAYLRKSFQTLEGACEELRNCRMFLKLLEAVLKTGNRMNVGTNRGAAEAFKLDTLLKLADVKGADGKTTLLHFVVQEIIRTEGARLSDTNQTTSSTLTEDAKCRRLGLQVISSLSSELANVKRAATMDFEALNSDVFKLSKGIASITEIVKLNQKAGSNESSQKFTESMSTFIRMAEEEILKLQAQGNVALSLVKEITEYFHGNLTKEEAHPFRIFMVVRDFLSVLDRVCKEVGTINERTGVSSAHKFPVPVNPMLPIPLPGLHGRKQCSSNPSDDDSLSP